MLKSASPKHKSVFPPRATRAGAQTAPPGRSQLVDAPFSGTPADGAQVGVAKVELTFDAVAPGRRIRVFKIRHEDTGSAVQRVDHHLSIRKSGDLHAPIQQFRGSGRRHPVAALNVFGLRKETGQYPAAELLLPVPPFA